MSEVLKQANGKNWTAYNGDSCEVIKAFPDNSIDFSVYSPPFANLYIYSDSMADMGNCEDMDEFIRHYEYLLREMHRVTVTGRLTAVHCKDLPLYFNRDGAAGLVDFPGKIVAAHERTGWTFHSRVTIWKCPVTERERTNNHGLLHKTVCKDSSGIRQGMADFVLVFRKVGENLLSDKPIARPKGFTRYVGDPSQDPRTTDYHPSKYARHRKSTTADVAAVEDDLPADLPVTDGHGRKARKLTASIDVWRRYAEPVWWDINQTDVLNFKLGRDTGDERHICPLQLGVIRRSVELWSNPGDVVFTPFLGVGSEGYVALQEGRKAVGIELKESYFDLACLHMRQAESEAMRKEKSLFAEESTA